MRKYVTIAIALVLTGCATSATTVDELVNTNNQDSFTVGNGYQQTYRNIRSGLEKCRGLESSWNTPSFVRSDLYTDINEGRITIYSKGGMAKSKPLVYVNVSEVDDSNSKVNIYYQWRGHVGSGYKMYQNWANGNMTCP